MGIIWRFEMVLLSTLAALVILVHSEEENINRDLEKYVRALDYDEQWALEDSVQTVKSYEIVTEATRVSPLSSFVAAASKKRGRKRKRPKITGHVSHKRHKDGHYHHSHSQRAYVFNDPDVPQSQSMPTPQEIQDAETQVADEKIVVAIRPTFNNIYKYSNEEQDEKVKSDSSESIEAPKIDKETKYETLDTYEPQNVPQNEPQNDEETEYEEMSAETNTQRKQTNEIKQFNGNEPKPVGNENTVPPPSTEDLENVKNVYTAAAMKYHTKPSVAIRLEDVDDAYLYRDEADSPDESEQFMVAPSLPHRLFDETFGHVDNEDDETDHYTTTISEFPKYTKTFTTPGKIEAFTPEPEKDYSHDWMSSRVVPSVKIRDEVVFNKYLTNRKSKDDDLKSEQNANLNDEDYMKSEPKENLKDEEYYQKFYHKGKTEQEDKSNYSPDSKSSEPVKDSYLNEYDYERLMTFPLDENGLLSLAVVYEDNFSPYSKKLIINDDDDHSLYTDNNRPYVGQVLAGVKTGKKIENRHDKPTNDSMESIDSAEKQTVASNEDELSYSASNLHSITRKTINIPDNSFNTLENMEPMNQDIKIDTSNENAKKYNIRVKNYLKQSNISSLSELLQKYSMTLEDLLNGRNTLRLFGSENSLKRSNQANHMSQVSDTNDKFEISAGHKGHENKTITESEKINKVSIEEQKSNEKHKSNNLKESSKAQESSDKQESSTKQERSHEKENNLEHEINETQESKTGQGSNKKHVSRTETKGNTEETINKSNEEQGSSKEKETSKEQENTMKGENNREQEYLNTDYRIQNRTETRETQNKHSFAETLMHGLSKIGIKRNVYANKSNTTSELTKGEAKNNSLIPLTHVYNQTHSRPSSNQSIKPYTTIPQQKVSNISLKLEDKAKQQEIIAQTSTMHTKNRTKIRFPTIQYRRQRIRQKSTTNSPIQKFTTSASGHASNITGNVQEHSDWKEVPNLLNVSESSDKIRSERMEILSPSEIEETETEDNDEENDTATLKKSKNESDQKVNNLSLLRATTATPTSPRVFKSQRRGLRPLVMNSRVHYNHVKPVSSETENTKLVTEINRTKQEAKLINDEYLQQTSQEEKDLKVTSNNELKISDDIIDSVNEESHQITNSEAISSVMISSTQRAIGSEIGEILNDTQTSVKLSKILMERNMTLNELVEHRERGSSNVHLADIFHNTSREPNPDPEPFLSKSLIEPISKETYPLRALLEANQHDPFIKSTTTESSQTTTQYIPVVMSFKNNVNENGENIGIISIFHRMASQTRLQNSSVQTDSMGTPYIATVINESVSGDDDSTKQSRMMKYKVNNNIENQVVSWKDMLESVKESEDPANVNHISRQPEDLMTRLRDQNEFDDKLIVMEENQHAQDINNNISPIEFGNEEIDTGTPKTVLHMPSYSKPITIAIATIIALATLLFLLTYAVIKWKQERRTLKKMDINRGIPPPVFEKRNNIKSRKQPSRSPSIATSHIYTLSTAELRKTSEESPDYEWENLRGPFQ